MISIPLKITLESIDSILKKIHASPDAPLIFPESISLVSMLSSASYIQMLLTWATLSSKREVIFTISEESKRPFLVSAPEKFIPLLLAKKVRVNVRSTEESEEINVNQLKTEGLRSFAAIKAGEFQMPLLIQ